MWTFGIGLISFNIIHTNMQPSSYTKELAAVFVNPFSESTHETLALAMWKNSLQAAAKQELLLANEFAPTAEKENTSRVLGASTTPLDLLRKWEQEPAKEAAALAYWQGVAATHSDYRDAYVQMATISYAQGNLVRAKSYLTLAAAIDPNGQAVNELLGFVSKQLAR